MNKNFKTWVLIPSDLLARVYGTKRGFWFLFLEDLIQSPTSLVCGSPLPQKKIPGVRIWFIRIRTVSFCFVLFLLHFAHYSLLFNNNKIIYRYGTNACVAGCLLKRRPSCRRAAALSSVPTVPHPAGWNS